MGEIAENSSDLVIITSDNPRREDPMLIIEDILEGIKNKDDVIVLADRAQAIHRALDEANAGDTVVLAGKGHETVQVIGTERKPFDDMAIAKKYLA